MVAMVHLVGPLTSFLSAHGQDHIQVAPQVHNLTAVFHVARDLTCQWACHASCGWGNFTFGGPGGHDIPDCASVSICLYTHISMSVCHMDMHVLCVTHVVRHSDFGFCSM